MKTKLKAPYILIRDRVHLLREILFLSAMSNWTTMEMK